MQKSDSLVLSVLCVGIDLHLMSYLYAATEFLNPSIDLSRNIDDAKRKLSFQFYDVYVIDLQGNEKDVFDLIELIKDKSTHKYYIALISNSYEQDQFFSHLKDKHIVDAFFTKPIGPQSVDQMVQEIKKKFSTEENSLLDVRLEKLKSTYDQTIPEKIESIKKLIETIKENPNSKLLHEFKDVVHKIAGTAGSFGYDEVTHLCKDMQNEIVAQLKHEKPTPQWISSLDLFLERFKKGFYKTTALEEKKKGGKEDTKIPLVFVIDPDDKFLKSIEQIKESFQLELKTCKDPSQALELINKGEITPDALFCSLEFPDSHYTGYTILNALHSDLHSRMLIKGLIIDQDNLDLRIDAVQRGINLVFKRPISPQSFLRMIEEATYVEKMRKFRVLILDDDVDFCNFALVVLAGVGIEVKAIYSSNDLFHELEEFKPNLLLLDLVLPKYDGLNLLKTLRQDAAYKHLPIFIVTGSDESSTSIDAYAAKADSVLFKPITVDLLQKRIISFLERQERYFSEDKSDTPSLESTHKNLMKKLYHLMHNHIEDCHLVLFETIPKPENSREATVLRDEESFFFNGLISNEIEVRIEYFGFDENVSALLIENAPLEEAKKKSINYFEDWLDKDTSNQKKIRAVILPVNEELSGHPEKLITLGESELSKIELSQKESLRLDQFLMNVSSVHKKEILIIDPDSELTKILKLTFEERGFHVRIFKLGQEGLDYLLNPNIKTMPSLIITERKLLDMDGITILKQLKKNLPNPPPIFILTVFSSDKDISEGLQLGATEYIVKPFNTALLIQKALKDIQDHESP